MTTHQLPTELTDHLPNLDTSARTRGSLMGADQDGRERESMATNGELVASGLAILRNPLSLYVCQGIADKYGESWWAEGVLETLVYEKSPTIEDVRRNRRLPESGTMEECANAFDVSVCLILLTKQWPRIFGSKLSRDHRGWAFELIGVRNVNKHLGGADHASDYAWRALDSMIRLCESIDADVTTELMALRSSVDLSSYGQVVNAPTRSSSSDASFGTQVELEADRKAAVSAQVRDSESNSDELQEELAVVGPDFSGADLRSMNFAGANLDGADFTEAKLTDANLKGAILTKAIFKGAQMGGVDLTDANLSGAFFEGTTLSDTRNIKPAGYNAEYVTRGANLTGATLDGATLNFAGSDLRKVNFAGANLDGADFTEAKLTDANLKGAILTKAIFKGAQMGGVDLTDANLSGAFFEGTTLSDTRNIKPAGYNAEYVTRGANLTGATLDGATLNFAGSDLRKVNFAGANLDGADFTEAKLTDANLKGASLKGVNLKGANIREANIEDVQWA